MADASAIISVARTGCGEILLEQTGQRGKL